MAFNANDSPDVKMDSIENQLYDTELRFMSEQDFTELKNEFDEIND